MPPLIFKKGLDLKHEVAHVLAGSYGSGLVAPSRNPNYQFAAGRLVVHLAREFGFCYGVDRAVDYAYQARRRFPIARSSSPAKSSTTRTSTTSCARRESGFSATPANRSIA